MFNPIIFVWSIWIYCTLIVIKRLGAYTHSYWLPREWEWICKNRPKPHKKWNPIYCWTLNPHSYTTEKHQMHGYRWLSLLSQIAFVDPVKPQRHTTCRDFQPVNGINNYVSDARMLPITVSTYPVDWVCFCHLL